MTRKIYDTALLFSEPSREPSTFLATDVRNMGGYREIQVEQNRKVYPDMYLY